MASKNTKPRAQTYSLLTDVQKNVLKRHFDNGMVGIGRQYREMITRAAEETNLTRDKVEVRLYTYIPCLIALDISCYNI